MRVFERGSKCLERVEVEELLFPSENRRRRRALILWQEMAEARGY